MSQLRETLHACLAAQGEPGDPDAELDRMLDDRIFALIDLLIERHDECGPEARACISKAAGR